METLIHLGPVVRKGLYPLGSIKVLIYWLITPVNKLVGEAGHNYKIMLGFRSPGKIDTLRELNKYNPLMNRCELCVDGVVNGCKSQYCNFFHLCLVVQTDWIVASFGLNRGYTRSRERRGVCVCGGGRLGKEKNRISVFDSSDSVLSWATSWIIKCYNIQFHHRTK